MNYHIPEKLLRSKYRKLVWKNSKIVLQKLEKIIPISEIHMLGSFTTKKKRPADIDVIILVKTKKKNKKKEKWSIDFQLVPDNKYGKWMSMECEKWVKQKYGLKKYALIKLK